MAKEYLPKYRYNARVLAVVDGDTLDLEVDLGFSIIHRMRVRLDGLDTPESAGKGKCAEGLAAKKFVAEMCEGKSVEMETTKTEKFGRYLATIWVKGVSLNDLLIEKGQAKAYSGGKRI